MLGIRGWRHGVAPHALEFGAWSGATPINRHQESRTIALEEFVLSRIQGAPSPAVSRFGEALGDRATIPRRAALARATWMPRFASTADSPQCRGAPRPASQLT